MTAYAGSLVTLKIGDGASPVESFTEVAGLQLKSLRIDRQLIEKSALSSTGWRELSSGGLRSVQLRGEGVFSDSAAEAVIQAQALSGTAANYKLLFGNEDAVQGAFIIRSYERSGQYSEAESFAVTLESAGVISLS